MSAIYTCEEHNSISGASSDSVMTWYGSSRECPACALQREISELEEKIEKKDDELDSMRDERNEALDRVDELEKRVKELELFLEEEKARE